MKLQELEQKYEELGKEIEKLKNEKKGKRWKPDKNDDYYVIRHGRIMFDCNKIQKVTDWDYSQGNCFKTRHEAEEHLENLKTKAELRALAEELNGDEVIDWSNAVQYKYCIDYLDAEGCLSFNRSTVYKLQGVIYCLVSNFRVKAIERIGEERLIKMIKSGV